VSEVLGVAVLGAGHMGADHIRRPDRVVSAARMVTVADPDAGRAEEAVAGIDGASVHTDVAGALDAPGVAAVLIASPGPAHEEALLACFARGLPVLCEKPMVPDSTGALRVVERRPAWGGGWRRSASCRGTTPVPAAQVPARRRPDGTSADAALHPPQCGVPAQIHLPMLW
jgi:hypothetical protein